MSNENITVYRNDQDELRIRVDAPGERAVSAAIDDPQALIDLINHAVSIHHEPAAPEEEQ